MPTIYNPNKRKGLFYIPSGAIKSESAAFSYSQDSYRVDESNPTPTITGETGGTFTSTPEGLTLNSSTGEITLSSSVINSYVVTYTLPSGTFESRSLGITAAAFASTQSFSFDGIDSKFTIEPITLASSYTISAWAKRDSTSNNEFLLGNNATFGYGAYFNGTNAIYFKQDSGNTTFNNSAITTALARTDWVNWVFVKDSSAGTISIYVDGTLAQSVTSALGMTNLTAIGGDGTAATNYIWDGNIDEVAIFSSALTSGNISTIYGSGTPSDLTSLNPSVWYRMGE